MAVYMRWCRKQAGMRNPQHLHRWNPHDLWYQPHDLERDLDAACSDSPSGTVAIFPLVLVYIWRRLPALVSSRWNCWIADHRHCPGQRNAHEYHHGTALALSLLHPDLAQRLMF